MMQAMATARRGNLSRRQFTRLTAGSLLSLLVPGVPQALALTPVCDGPADPPAAGPVAVTSRRRLYVRGDSPAEIWADILRHPEDLDAARFLVQTILGDIRRHPSWQVAWKLVTSAAYRLIYQPFGHFMAESDFFADVLGSELVSRADMAGLQRLYSLAHAGCSTVMLWDAGQQRMVHFRSLDWPGTAALARASRIFDAIPAAGAPPAFRAAGVIGMTGLLSAVKPGFSVAINFAPWTGPSVSLNPDPTFLLRHLMESPVSSYAEAAAAIARWTPSAPVFISLCGIRREESCIFEFGANWDPSGLVHRIDIGQRPFLVQTNHFSPGSPFAQHNKTARSLPPDSPDWDKVGLLNSSQARRQLIEQGLEEALRDAGADLSLETVLHQLWLRRPVWNCETAQWVQMTPADGELALFVRPG